MARPFLKEPTKEYQQIYREFLDITYRLGDIEPSFWDSFDSLRKRIVKGKGIKGRGSICDVSKKGLHNLIQKIDTSIELRELSRSSGRSTLAYSERGKGGHTTAIGGLLISPDKGFIFAPQTDRWAEPTQYKITPDNLLVEIPALLSLAAARYIELTSKKTRFHREKVIGLWTLMDRKAPRELVGEGY